MPETTLRYVGDRLMQCKDIPDQLVLDAVTDREPGWSTQTTGRICEALEQQLGPVPWNLLLAKLRRLVARGLIDGCPCGCSGGFTIPGRQEPSAGDALAAFDRWLAAYSAAMPADVPATFRGPNWKA